MSSATAVSVITAKFSVLENIYIKVSDYILYALYTPEKMSEHHQHNYNQIYGKDTDCNCLEVSTVNLYFDKVLDHLRGQLVKIDQSSRVQRRY